MLSQLPHPSQSLGHFAWICDAVRGAIAPHTRSDTPAGRLLTFIYSYLGRVVPRIDRLFIRWRAGKIRPARPCAPRPRTPRAENPDRPRIRLPRGQSWLLKAVQKTAIGQEQLRLLLLDAEFQDFLRQVAAARCILRPLCIAVGLEMPDYLTLPPRKRKPRPPKPKAEPILYGKYRTFNYHTYSPGRTMTDFSRRPRSAPATAATPAARDPPDRR